jgi:RNA polymerase sigma-70 factor (ECF subfamily)
MDIECIYKEESGRVLATVIGIVGDFDLAEEAVQEAFATALEKWPAEGAPKNPRAWLVATARNRALDRLRRRSRVEKHAGDLEGLAPAEEPSVPFEEPAGPELDDRLRLIFTCCHPALATEAQVALTLRTLCGLATEEIARSFLVPVPTMAQRLVRAKQKIRDAGIPYRVPEGRDFSERLDAVLLAIYLVFTEGYAATFGDAMVRRELCAEAIRLGRLVVELMPRRSEPVGLLALMLLHDSRRDARVSADGVLVPLEEQDRSLWDRDEIREGAALVEEALRGGGPGVYPLQAAIAALHAQAARSEETDWAQIAALYDILLEIHPSPVIELNRAAAVAMARGPEVGLRLLDGIVSRGELDGYHLLPAARADLLRRLARWEESAAAYARALALAENEAERRYLTRRLAEVRRAAKGVAP